MQAPAWSLAAMVELVVPLAITVLVVQNGQGIAVLQGRRAQAAGQRARPCCAASAPCSPRRWAPVSSCLTGPTNALITHSGERHRHYTAAMVTGGLAIAFGLLAPAFTGLMLATPKAYIMTLGGLAMLRVLQGATSPPSGSASASARWLASW